MEIKKAFETMKKELKKETGIEGGFTMSAKQMANKTATYLICNLIPYEKEIEDAEKACARVRGSNTRTEEEKNRWCANYEKVYIPFWKEQLAQYGTKENFAKAQVEKIMNSKAFAKFAEAVGGVRCNVEAKNNGGLDLMYLRFNY